MNSRSKGNYYFNLAIIGTRYFLLIILFLFLFIINLSGGCPIKISKGKPNPQKAVVGIYNNQDVYFHVFLTSLFLLQSKWLMCDLRQPRDQKEREIMGKRKVKILALWQPTHSRWLKIIKSQSKSTCFTLRPCTVHFKIIIFNKNMLCSAKEVIFSKY